MEIESDLLGHLANFTAGELLAANEVCKVISYHYFTEYRRNKSKPVKVKLDAMCDFISHIELTLKDAEKVMSHE